MGLIKQKHNESLEYKREFVEQYKQNKKDKEVAEALDKKQLPKGKEVKMKKSFYLYVGDTIFSVWFNGHDYRFINLSNNKISWLSPGEEKTLGREGEIHVDEIDTKASRNHLKLKVDDKNNLFLCDNSKHGTFVDSLSEDNNKLTILEMFQDLTGETGEYNFKDGRWNRLTFEKYEKLKKIENIFDIKTFGTDGKKCQIVGVIDDSVIDDIIKNRTELSKIMNNHNRNYDMIIFYSKLVENGILNDFMEIFDKYEGYRCFLEYISYFEGINFSKIKEMKEYIKSKNTDITFDYYTIDRLNSLESIEYVGNILLKGVEKGGENYVILNANKLGTDHIRAEKQGENEYIINAHMPDNPKMAGRAYILMFECLPKGAKIVEKKSLSVNSFNNIINLYTNKKFQEKLGIKEVVIQNKVQLNNEGEDGELAKLIKDKNIGKDIELFETDSKDDAELIVNEINILIYKHTGDNSIHAEVKEIEKDGGDNTWGVELPSYRIEKL